MRSRSATLVRSASRAVLVALVATWVAAPVPSAAQRPPRPAPAPRTPSVERPKRTPPPRPLLPDELRDTHDAMIDLQDQLHDLTLDWNLHMPSFELDHDMWMQKGLMDFELHPGVLTPEPFDVEMLHMPFPELPPIPEMPHMPEVWNMPAMTPFPELPNDVEWPTHEWDLRLTPPADVWRDLVPRAATMPRALREHPKEPWATQDPADSLYRRARELLNRGDWRRAAAAFRDIPQRFPNSAYAADALYWQAFALYRIGGSSELREALAALDVQRGKYPNAETQADASALATRIRGALAARGDAAAGAVVARTASERQGSCDQEEQAVRIEALSALSQTDPENVGALIDKILQRKDECSVQLRRSALFLVASRRDAGAAAILVSAAKNDPSPQVRGAAVEWMARIPNDDVVSALEEIVRSDDERLQRAAVRALVAHPSARARTAVRSLIQRTDVPEGVRAEALSSFDREHSSAEDAAWLRQVYPKLETVRLKVRALSALTRIGGPDVDQLLMSIVKNDDEPTEIRSAALRRLGQTLSIADLARFYDSASERQIREEILNALSQRKEPEATDKLIDIVKTGTDPQLRREAISALTRKKDPRTVKLLMEIIDK